MRLLYNPFRKRKKTNGLWTKLQLLSNFTWSNKKAIESMQLRIEQHSFQINEMMLMFEENCCTPTPKKRGRPRKKKS